MFCSPLSRSTRNDANVQTTLESFDRLYNQMKQQIDEISEIKSLIVQLSDRFEQLRDDVRVKRDENSSNSVPSREDSKSKCAQKASEDIDEMSALRSKHHDISSTVTSKSCSTAGIHLVEEDINKTFGNHVATSLSDNMYFGAWRKLQQGDQSAVVSYSVINKKLSRREEDGYFGDDSQPPLTHIKTTVRSICSKDFQGKNGNLSFEQDSSVQMISTITVVNLFLDMSDHFPSMSRLLLEYRNLRQSMSRLCCNRSTARQFMTRVHDYLSNLEFFFEESLFYPTTDGPRIDGNLLTISNAFAEAVRSFEPLTQKGYLKNMLQGTNFGDIFSEVDSRLNQVMTNLSTLTAMRADRTSSRRHQSAKYQLPPCNYVFRCDVNEEMILRAYGHQSGLIALAQRIDANMSELSFEVADLSSYLMKSYNRVFVSTRLSPFLYDSAFSIVSVLDNKVLRQFWMDRFGQSTLKVTYSNFANGIECTLRIAHPDAANEISAVDDVVNAIKHSIIHLSKDVIEKQIDDEINVFDLNRCTRHINESYNFLEILLTLSTPSKKIIPPVPINLWSGRCLHSSPYVTIWGEGLKESIENSVLSNIRTMNLNMYSEVHEIRHDYKELENRGSWTIVHGCKNSGKSFRWLLLLHDLPSSYASIWLDIYGVHNRHDFYLSIAEQLSIDSTTLPFAEHDGTDENISIVYQDCILLRLEQLIIDCSEWEEEQCIFVIDHIDSDNMHLLNPLLEMLCRLQFESKITLRCVFILRESLPPSEMLAHLQCEISNANIDMIDVHHLPRIDALELASTFDIDDPSLIVDSVIQSENILPGDISNLAPLLVDELTKIDRTSIDSDIIPYVTAECMSSDDIKVATCLYPVLAHGVSFTVELAWILCRDELQSYPHPERQFSSSLDWLIAVGWLKVIAGKYLFIPSYSRLKQSIVMDTPVLQKTGLFMIRTDSSISSLLTAENQNASTVRLIERYLDFWANEMVRYSSLSSDTVNQSKKSYGLRLFSGNIHHIEIVFAILNSYGRKAYLGNAKKLSSSTRSSVNIDLALNFRKDFIFRICTSIAAPLTSLMKHQFSIQRCVSIFESLILCMTNTIFTESNGSDMNDDVITRIQRRESVRRNSYKLSSDSIMTPTDIGVIPPHADNRYYFNDESNRVVVLGLCRALGWYHYQVNNFSMAVKILESVVACFRSDEDADLAITMGFLAQVYLAVENFEQAEHAYVKCLDIHENVYGSSDSNTLLSLKNLASLYVVIGKYQDALSCYRRYYDILCNQLSEPSLFCSNDFFVDDSQSDEVSESSYEILLEIEELLRKCGRNIEANEIRTVLDGSHESLPLNE